ncbi:hypothetical protein K435DRAFT_784138 [Dendrothele bispora CBS 962.96]|uniref:Wax synthase domain-containing protein n=1 Tax=Dendrothele bispora (strain CBS 962.96) TaxID=1314807 RepID=A0A4S8L4U1_DENBC|nr:hypothetical protein K435DRAFT_784138 [Dendrothele bispora CBS 962.96]
MNYLFVSASLTKCIILIGLVVRSSPYRWLLWVPVAAVNTYCYLSTDSENSLRVQVLLDTLTASDYILLTDVQREFRQVGQREPISSAGIWPRFKWALQLWISPRGVGWNFEPKSSLPPHPNLTKLEFLRSRFISLALALIGNDIAFILASSDPGFSKHAPAFHKQPVTWRLYATALFFFRTRSALTVNYLMISLLCVGTGMTEPSSWPDLFGKWGHSYTLRRFWGVTWHQQLRRIFSSHGRFLAHRVFGFPSGSIASSYTQLYVAFFLSSIIHVLSFDFRPFRFFLLQAVVITFEDTIILIGREYRVQKKLTIPFRLLGYLWVYWTLTLTLGPWFDTMNVAGVNEYNGAYVLGFLRDWLLSED